MTGNPEERRSTPIRRLPNKESHDREHLLEILDRSRIGHVAIDDGGPVVIPVAVAYWHDATELLIHGSTASRLFKKLSEGVPACISLTILEGLVLARSSFESSMHYKSLIAFGSARRLEGQEKEEALLVLTEHLLPERTNELRASTTSELKATSILAFPLDDFSIKVSSGDPKDSEEDVALPIWAGVVPIREIFGEPRPARDLDPSIPVPDYIKRW